MSDINILFVNVNGLESSYYGGPKGTIRNFECLKQYGNIIPYNVKIKSAKDSIISVLNGYFPPVSKIDKCNIEELIIRDNIDVVFFDQSFYGSIVKDVKRLGCKTIVFCHNCEKDFLDARFSNAKHSIKYLIYRHLVKNNERRALQNADVICTFLERDSRRIEQCYKNVSVHYEIPLAIEDKFHSVDSVISKSNDSCVIFGPATNVNMIGVKWFIEKVSPLINCKTIIIGKGWDEHKELESEKVSVEGYVESIEDAYKKSNIIVIPQLEGAGMKVKTVEALMFGKYIIGTKEAFEGFDINISDVGVLCESARDFIDNINRLLVMNLGFNWKSRDIYKEKYSVESSQKIFGRVIENLIKK